jgi:hypothetical protein
MVENFCVDPPGQPAPLWTTSEWFNTDGAVQLADLRGRVVVLHAFQMLCPACVHHGVPQAQRIHTIFAAQDVQVIGLHTVFEHHAAMRPVSLQAFLHEYRITMRLYGLQGTPSLLLIDRRGFLRLQAFGAKDDLEVGAAIATLVNEAA